MQKKKKKSKQFPNKAFHLLSTFHLFKTKKKNGAKQKLNPTEEGTIFLLNVINYF